MYGMNRIPEIGCCCSCGRIYSTQRFMEFQAYNVLVIASDIRQLEHIEYTPAPDIIHEGAGHANYRESRICRIFTSFWRNRLQSHFI
jgi:phenylalanine-4-hydroxylase